MYINLNVQIKFFTLQCYILILHFQCLYVEYHQFLVVGVAVAVYLLAFWLLLKEKTDL